MDSKLYNFMLINFETLTSKQWIQEKKNTKKSVNFVRVVCK